MGDGEVIHPSHTMGPWESTIVTILNTPRFGDIRRCTKCDGEEAKTATGRAIQNVLKHPCSGES